MTTIHAYPKAMRAAVEAAKGSDLCLLGVTVLTSMNDCDLKDAGYAHEARDLVLERARDASAAGMGGVVASAKEASDIRKIIDPKMAIVTPGIRPLGSDVGDQKRVMTRATHLVVGRPVTVADDPKSAAQIIIDEIAANA